MADDVVKSDVETVGRVIAEVEGVRYVMVRGNRHHHLPSLRDGVPDGVAAVAVVSFDAGATWHESTAEAFRAAKAGKRLVEYAPAPEAVEELPPEAAAVVVDLLAQIRALRPGDSLEIRRGEADFTVSKQRYLTTFAASSIDEIGVEPAEDQEDDDHHG